MATIEDLENAIRDERAEVRQRIDALVAEMQALKDSIGNGVVVSQEQMQGLIEGVNNIHTSA